jgi:hypothetical protein
VTHREKYKEFLIIFSNTVVDPRAMMIHFLYTSSAHTGKVFYSGKNNATNSMNKGAHLQ